MIVRILSPANRELDEAIQYFEMKKPGLRNRFSDEILKTIMRIRFMPNTWTKVGVNTRRCLLERFMIG